MLGSAPQGSCPARHVFKGIVVLRQESVTPQDGFPVASPKASAFSSTWHFSRRGSTGLSIENNFKGSANFFALYITVTGITLLTTMVA